jgi:SAM-dependent methyltransferase
MAGQEILRFLVRWNRAFGFDPKKLLLAMRGIAPFARDYATFRRSEGAGLMRMPLLAMYPALDDRYSAAGTARGHYFNQDLWAAREIFQANPKRHVDIGSRIDGFIGHLLVFRSVEVVDVRPLATAIPGLLFIQSDATNLSIFSDNALESVSSLHAAEHFGLGRFGDPVDPLACFKFMASLSRVLKAGGRLYFSVPVGRERIEFNGHRIFSPDRILEQFRALRLLQLHAVLDDGLFHENVSVTSLDAQVHACGLFQFTK